MKMIGDWWKQNMECACNLFTTLLKENQDAGAIGFNTADAWIDFNNKLLNVAVQIGFCQFQQSMDRLLEPADKKCVRNIMLKHEQIFKQQVHELHRLYRTQKMLMAELRKQVKCQSISNATLRVITDTKSRCWSSNSTSETSNSSCIDNKDWYTKQRASQCSPLQPCNTRDKALRMKNIFDLELTAEEDTANEVMTTTDRTAILGELSKETMAINRPALWTHEESELELTLSIGRGPENKKSRQWLCRDVDLVCSKITPKEVRPEKRGEYNDPSAHFDRESSPRPPFLVHTLSLNRT